MKLVAFAVAVVLLLPTRAAAGTTITHVDASAYPTIRVTIVAPDQASAPVVMENGTRAPAQVATNAAAAKSVGLAVDRSQSMRGASLDNAVAAARAFVAAKPRRDRVAIITFGSRAVRLTRFSSATIDADLALRTLGVDGRSGTALYDAVVAGAEALAVEPLRAKVLVLVTDGTDVSSTAGLEEAVSAARRAHVAVHTIGIGGPQFSPAQLRELAARTGGTYHGARSSEALSSVYAQVGATLRRTWQVDYTTRARPGDVLKLGVGTASSTLALPGTPAPGRAEPSKLVPRVAYERSWGPFVFGGAAGLLLVLALANLAGAGRGRKLRTRLAAHVDARGRAARRRGKTTLGAVATLMQATERSFGAFRLWQRINRLILRADLPLRTVEFFYIVIGSSFLLGTFATFVAPSAFYVLVAFAGGAAAPFGVLHMKAKRRGRAFEDQLPDILQTIAASLKAGHSFKHGLQSVANESEDPAQKEFKRVLNEIRLGRPVEQALTEVAERLDSKNLEFVVTAVTIQSQVGGSLAGLFDMVADAVRNRQQFARKIRGLTAMGRASAYVLLALPFGLVGLISLVNGEYLDPLFHTPVGRMMIMVGLTMMGIGSLILKKIVSFRG